MNTVDVIKFFGSKPKAAQAMNITKQAIGQWGDTVPELRQYQVEVITHGQLKSDYTLERLRRESEK